MERAINSKLGNLISLLGSDVNQLDNLKKSKEKKACLTSRNLTFPFLKIIYLFNFCAGSSLLWGLFSSCSGQASHCGSFPCWGTWALEYVGFSSYGSWAQWFWLLGSRAQTQKLWHMGLVGPQHVGSSWIRDWTCVSCIDRQILYHLATREAPCQTLIVYITSKLMEGEGCKQRKKGSQHKRKVANIEK